jgi:hypothetical protein
MTSVKPIETHYKGFRFRSRLEARWAVFFDTLGVRYEYELEGFSLPSGAAYLPDFFLPELKLFVEVKPTEQVLYSDLKKILEFALEGDHQLLLIVGSPTQENAYLINRVTCSTPDEYAADFERQATDEQLVEVVFEGLKDWGYVQFGVTPLSRGWGLIYKTLPPYDDHNLQEALLRAKQARFEHGEEG